MLAWDIPRSAASRPPLRLLRMLQVPNLIGTFPLVALPVLLDMPYQRSPIFPVPPLAPVLPVRRLLPRAVPAGPPSLLLLPFVLPFPPY